jgi:hypothetical protein
VDAKNRPVWELPRDKGGCLRQELARAYAARAGLICISSWNNYVAGDFIEPNSLDGEAPSKALAAAVRQAREASRAPGQPPPREEP